MRQERGRKNRKSKYPAKSVSQSRASNTSSNDDNINVNVTVARSGSAFSGSGGYAFHALRRRLRGNDTVLLPGKNEIVEANEAEHKAEDPDKRVLICHLGMRTRGASRMRRRRRRKTTATMAIATAITLALDVLPCFAVRCVKISKFSVTQQNSRIFWTSVFFFYTPHFAINLISKQYLCIYSFVFFLKKQYLLFLFLILNINSK